MRLLLVILFFLSFVSLKAQYDLVCHDCDSITTSICYPCAGDLLETRFCGLELKSGATQLATMSRPYRFNIRNDTSFYVTSWDAHQRVVPFNISQVSTYNGTSITTASQLRDSLLICSNGPSSPPINQDLLLNVDSLGITSGESVSYSDLTDSISNWKIIGSDIYRESLVGLGATVPANLLHLKDANPTTRIEDDVDGIVGYIGNADNLTSGTAGWLAIRGENGLYLSGQGNSQDVLIHSGVLDINASLERNISAVAVTTTVAKGTYVWEFDTSSGTLTADLPAAPTKGEEYRLVNLGSNGLIIDPNGATTINGSATYTIGSGVDYRDVYYNDTEWITVPNPSGSTPTYGSMSFVEKAVTVVTTGGDDHITDGTATLFNKIVSSGAVTIAGDSIIINVTGNALISISYSFEAGNNNNYRFKVTKDDVVYDGAGFQRETANTKTGNGSTTFYMAVTSGEVIKPVVDQIAGVTDPTFIYGSVSITMQ